MRGVFDSARLLVRKPFARGGCCLLINCTRSAPNFVSTSAAGSFNPGPSWQIRGVGDFNGDNKSDILWQSSDGTPAIWLMNGTNAVSIGAVGPFNPGPSWQVRGAEDFNGDGRADILWQGSDGTPAVWLMDGLNFLSASAVGPFNPGMDWHVIV